MQWKSHASFTDDSEHDFETAAMELTSCQISPFSSRSQKNGLRKDKRARLNQSVDTAAPKGRVWKKCFYVHVSEEGRPYGLGIGAWNDALGKVVWGLNTSYIDIRQQPFHLMDTLIARLNEGF